MDFENVHRKLLNRDPATRVETVRELADSGDGSVLPFVYGALEDRTPQVRHAANEALLQLRFGVGVLTAIDRAASHDDSERLSAVTLLREYPDARAAERLQRIAADADEVMEIRTVAIGALEALGSESSIELLLDLLDNEHTEVRSAAIGALGGIAIPVEPDAMGIVPEIQRIAEYMSDRVDDDESHALAARALGRCDWPSALNYLAEALCDERPALRRVAAEVVAERKDARRHEGVVEAVRKLQSTESDPEVREAVRRAVEALKLDQ